MLIRLAMIGLAVISTVPAVLSAPIVTMTSTPNIGGTGNTAYDFYYSASDGAEFTTYDIVANITNASDTVGILDPNRGATNDEGGDAIDTWANTVYSVLGFGPASYFFNFYRPTGLFQSPLLAPVLDWTVFDFGTGDNNAPVEGISAPYKLVRLLTTPTATGTARFEAFDTLSGSTPTIFHFNLGPPFPLGDYDHDGSVDHDDHLFWQANFGATIGAGLDADGNGNGVVDAADYIVWRDHLAAGLSASLAPVPEPAGGVCVLIACAALTLARSKRPAGQIAVSSRRTDWKDDR